MEEPRQRTKKNTIFWTPVQGECFECSEPADHLHHVVPFSAGGTRCVPLCEPCHAKASYVKRLGTPEDIKKGKRRAIAKGKRPGGRKSKHSPALIALIEEMYKNGLNIGQITTILVADNTWPMPEGYLGRYRHHSDGTREWVSAESAWRNVVRNRIRAALDTGKFARELLVNARAFELQKVLGEDAPPVVPLPPVYKNQNLPSLFTIDGDINPDAAAQ